MAAEKSPFDTSTAEKAGSATDGKDKDGKSKESAKSSTTKKQAIGSLAFEQRIGEAGAKLEKPDAGDIFNKLFVRESSLSEAAETDPDAERATDQPEMTVDDRRYAAETIAKERQAEIAAEPESDEESMAAAAAAQEFYDKIIAGAEMPEMAATEMLEQLQADTGDGDDESLTSDAENDVDQFMLSSESIAEMSDEADEPDPLLANAGSGQGGSRTPPPPNSGTPTAGGNANPNQPPIYPVVPPHLPTVAQPQPGIPRANPNTPQTGPQTPAESSWYYIGRSHAFGDALIGGIVGYALGRRQGRIKTERKMQPVQNRLEREAKQLKQTIAEKEFAIREAARKKLKQQKLLDETNKSRLQKPERPTPLTEKTIPLRGAESSRRETVIIDRSKNTERTPKTVEAQRSVAPEIQPEQIGKIMVAAEAVVTRALKTVEAVPGVAKTEVIAGDKRSVEKQVEVLSRNELLNLSEKVIVEGSTLRQVYETHLVSERGLRRLIAEYLRGGNVVKAFKRELIEREIDFERDPKLRDSIRKNLKSSGGASSSLKNMLEQVGIDSDNQSRQELAQVRSNQLYEAKQQAKKNKNRQIMDVSLVTIIGVLIAIIIVLAINKL
jgi:hypothetical protein